MIGETGKKNRITTETAEHPAQLPHVGTEQAVALRAAYPMSQPFTGQQFVPVSYVGQVPFLTMPALVEFGAEYGTLERRQIVYPKSPDLVRRRYLRTDTGRAY